MSTETVSPATEGDEKKKYKPEPILRPEVRETVNAIAKKTGEPVRFVIAAAVKLFSQLKPEDQLDASYNERKAAAAKLG